MLGLKVYKKYDSNAKKTLERGVDTKKLPKYPDIEGFDELRKELINLEESGRVVNAWAAVSKFSKKLSEGDTAVIGYWKKNKFYVGEYYKKFDDPERKLEVHLDWGTGKQRYSYENVFFLLDVKKVEVSPELSKELNEINDNRFGTILTGEKEDKVKEILSLRKNGLSNIISRYEDFYNSSRHKNEEYKWDHFQHFKEKWPEIKNLEGKEFFEGLKDAMRKQENLLHWRAIDKIRDVFESRPSEATLAFKELLNEEKEIEDRIDKFFKIFWESHGKPGDRRTTSFFLASLYPEKYVHYKYTEFKKFFDDFDINLTYGFNSDERTKHYLEVNKKAEEILHKINLEKSNMWNVQDLIYYYNKYRKPQLPEKEAEKKDIKSNRENDKRKNTNFDKKIELESIYFPEDIDPRDSIKAALKCGKHLILIGPPGTGKSKLAKKVCETFSPEEPKTTTANSDWSTFDTIGGYKQGKDKQLYFAEGVFLECFRNGEIPGNKWLVLDEINRTDIDKAFGSLFSALTGDEVTLSLKKKNNDDEERNIVIRPQRNEEIKCENYEYVIPEDWRIVATMNTFDKASLYEMSYAFMRRFAYIQVPVPKKIDKDLIRRYLDGWGIENESYVNKVVDVWKIINEYRKIGPAIVEDIYRFLIESESNKLNKAIEMYVYPQFEGLPDSKIIEFLKRLRNEGSVGDKCFENMKDSASDFFRIERERFEEEDNENK